MMAVPDSDAPVSASSQPRAANGSGVLSAGSARSSSVSDKAADEDLLGFKDYVKAIANFLKAPDTEAPLTLSIEGEWGSGKSSFLLQLKKALEAGPAPAVVISFNAWRYDKQDELWAAFALHVTRGLRNGVSFWRRYWGDLKLFFSRIKGVVGWLDLLGFVLLWGLLLGAVAGLLYWSLHADATTRAEQLASLLPQKAATAVTNVGAKQSGVALFALKHGPWAGSLALLFAAFSHLGASVRKRLLDFRLERFLDRPDYHGHAAFLEAFHQDFAKTLDAYVGSGTQKVYVLVDDLDRCDVPKAAELMQAINLMIGDNQHLVFILAMDREKVASGIAYKYKDVLPYLAEFASAVPAVAPTPATEPASAAGAPTPSVEDRIAFGHAFLEKFIQLSFRIPATDDDEQLRRFLQRLSPAAPAPWLSLDARLGSFERQAWASLSARLIKIGAWGWLSSRLPLPTPLNRVPAPGTTPQAVDQSIPAEPAPQSFTEFCRMTTGDESEDVLKVVVMVKDIFRSNPRRLKLFLNAFRLSFYLASGQGRFDRSPGSGSQPITIEQLGKFIALGMRCAPLYKKLAEKPELLGTYEQDAIKSASLPEGSSLLPSWLDRPGVAEVLRYGVAPWDAHYEPSRYSLADFPISKMLRVVPFAAAPRPFSSESRVLDGLIADLEAHLNSPARERDPRLAKVAARAIEEKCVGELIAKHTSGRIIDIVVALGTAVAAAAKDPDDSFLASLANEWLALALQYLQYSGPGQVDLVQHQALLLARQLLNAGVLDSKAQQQLGKVLGSQIARFNSEGSREKNRLRLAQEILGRLAGRDDATRQRRAPGQQVLSRIVAPTPSEAAPTASSGWKPEIESQPQQAREEVAAPQAPRAPKAAVRAEAPPGAEEPFFSREVR